MEAINKSENSIPMLAGYQKCAECVWSRVGHAHDSVDDGHYYVLKCEYPTKRTIPLVGCAMLDVEGTMTLRFTQAFWCAKNKANKWWTDNRLSGLRQLFWGGN